MIRIQTFGASLAIADTAGQSNPPTAAFIITRPWRNAWTGRGFHPFLPDPTI